MRHNTAVIFILLLSLTHYPDLFNESCKRKIKVLKDKKLAEINFKILNNILPCNRNLLKWGEVKLICVAFVRRKKPSAIYCFIAHMLNLYGMW